MINQEFSALRNFIHCEEADRLNLGDENIYVENGNGAFPGRNVAGEQERKGCWGSR